ncbi:hypothetical protein [Megasphaera elsdenii]|uniref:hypothetical protein n=1 Tax=Megasphaera elsdenii TaxID=907 RepID=UPI00242D79C3|nr:hypothetical protein [Megasphaera elsdenii]
MGIKKILASVVLGSAFTLGFGLMAPQPIQAESVWAYTRSNGQYTYVDTSSIYVRPDGGFNVSVRDGNFTCPMMFRYVDGEWCAMYGGDVLTPISDAPMYQAVFNVCQQYM